LREQDFANLLETAQRLERGIIAIDGASALGKTAVARRLGCLIGATVITTDSYATPRAERTVSPYDPSCFRFDDLVADVLRLQRGETITLGEYDHQTGRNGPSEPKHPTPVLIIEGVHSIRLRDHLQVDLSVFLDAPEHVRRARRRERDQRLGQESDDNPAWRRQCAAYRQHRREARHAAIVSTVGA
jgi:uridine kinase